MSRGSVTATVPARPIGLVLLLATAALAPACLPAHASFRIAADDKAVTVQDAEGRTVLLYQLVPPAQSNLAVDSAAFFHPLTTPAGTQVTALAPGDHRHHRGVFLAWFEMHGDVSADFWGWGVHAPTQERRIEHRTVSRVAAGSDGAGFAAENEWVAEGTVMVHEQVDASLRRERTAHVVDLTYTLTPTYDITLPRRAFSGFCARLRIDGELTAHGPEGPVDRPNPHHEQPDSNWPAEPWYAYDLQLEDGASAGVALIDHPGNPPSLWHNHRGIGLLNPVIMGSQDVVMEAGEPFVLRYRLVVYDGSLDRDLVQRLAEQWRQKQ